MNAIFDPIAFTTHYLNTPVWCHHRVICINITESLLKTRDQKCQTLGRKFNSIKLCIHLNLSRVASKTLLLHLVTMDKQRSRSRLIHISVYSTERTWAHCFSV